MNSIIAPVADVVAWVITALWNLLGPVFGRASGLTWVLCIVLLTMLMRLIMVPLFIKQMHTQRAMTALAPKMAEIRKKYKNDRETLNAETMKLYQEAGVNPLMGCLPVVLQMPIFFGLFSVLRQIATYHPSAHTQPAFHLSNALVASADQAKIFGAKISDVFLRTPSMEVKVVIGITVAISMITTYLTFRQSMKRGMVPTSTDNPLGNSQKMMGYIMPFFALSGLFWQFGLVLYWVTSNLWTLGQQYVLLRKYPVGVAVLGPDGSMPGKEKSKPAGPGGRGTGGAAGLTGRPARGVTGGSGSAGASKPGAQKPGTQKPGTQKPGPAKPGASKPGPAKPGPGRVESPLPGPAGDGSMNGKAGSGQGDEPAAKPDRTEDQVDTGSSGGKAKGPGGLLGRLGRGRSEAEPPQAAEPEAKLIRQQRQRQSRSKRTGKR